MMTVKTSKEVDKQQPLLVNAAADIPATNLGVAVTEGGREDHEDLKTRVWIETKNLWHIVGPSIFNRMAEFSMILSCQAIAGHLGNVELAAMSIGLNIASFNFGLLLGMASALETLCGQAFGAKRYYMLGIYMQRSWIVLFICCTLLLPFYLFATPMLKLLGQPVEVAEQTGVVALWFIPFHFSLAFQCPLQRFLQSQLKTNVVAWVSLVALVINVLASWVLVYWLRVGVVGAAIALDIAWWVEVFGMLGYPLSGKCAETWNGFSMEAFADLWEFLKFSSASGVMLCLENWYYRILILMTGNLKNATIAIDALSVCMSINDWELLIPFAFLTAIGVRVSNELGARNGKAAKFATKVSVAQSTIIGVLFCAVIIIFHDKLAFMFSTSTEVHQAVDKLAYFLALAILLNSVQPVLSGVALGSGWQSTVACVNLCCYYLVGLPLGYVMGWVFKLGVQGIWGGMILGGSALQTAILAIITITRNWEEDANKAAVHFS